MTATPPGELGWNDPTVSNTMIKPNNSISLKIWYNHMSSFCSKMLFSLVCWTCINAHVYYHRLSKATVFIIAVKVLGMLHYTLILSHCIQDDIENFSQSSCQIAQILRSKNSQKGDQLLYQISDFCENYNPILIFRQLPCWSTASWSQNQNKKTCSNSGFTDCITLE